MYKSLFSSLEVNSFHLSKPLQSYRLIYRKYYHTLIMINSRYSVNFCTNIWLKPGAEFENLKTLHESSSLLMIYYIGKVQVVMDRWPKDQFEYRFIKTFSTFFYTSTKIKNHNWKLWRSCAICIINQFMQTPLNSCWSKEESDQRFRRAIIS